MTARSVVPAVMMLPAFCARCRCARPWVRRRGIAELDIEIVDGRLVGFHLRLGAVDRRLVGVQKLGQRIRVAFELLALLLGENTLFHQLGVTLCLFARVLGVGGVAIQIGFRLEFQGRALLQVRHRRLHLAFQRFSVNQKQDIVLLDVIALFEIDLGEHAAGLGPHRDHRVGLHVADHRNVHRHVLQRDLGDFHRHRPAAGILALPFPLPFAAIPASVGAEAATDSRMAATRTPSSFEGCQAGRFHDSLQYTARP